LFTATDEHGTPAELAAAEAGLPVADYCAQQHEIQADVYRRLDLSFDYFGRSSSPQNRTLTQHFFKRLDERGFIEERTLNQVYSLDDGRFLPDRYVVGTCPHCRFDRARRPTMCRTTVNFWSMKRTRSEHSAWCR
jgi:methionyl-tRNA synthetase